MKVKTSITLSEDVLKDVDRLLGRSGNRSGFVEQALREYILLKDREIQEARDLAIINRRQKELNEEAMDVLSFQADI